MANIKETRPAKQGPNLLSRDFLYLGDFDVALGHPPILLTGMPRVSTIQLYYLPTIESINGGCINSKGLGFLTPCFFSTT